MAKEMCGWKTSKKTKGLYQRVSNTDTGKWYTQTSTRTQANRKRGVTRTWSGARQLGRNVYLSGGPYSGVWFESSSYTAGSGQESYIVHWPASKFDGTGGTIDMLNYFGVPYNKVWYGGENKTEIKVPTGALLDMSWPWSPALGYPTKWDVHYWIWTVGDVNKQQVDYAEWQDWITYIDVNDQLTETELKDFMLNIQKDFVDKQGSNDTFIKFGLITGNRDDLLALIDEIGSFYADVGWTPSTLEKQAVATLWGTLWTMVLDDDGTFNKIWFKYYQYL